MPKLLAVEKIYRGKNTDVENFDQRHK